MKESNFGLMTENPSQQKAIESLITRFHDLTITQADLKTPPISEALISEMEEGVVAKEMAVIQHTYMPIISQAAFTADSYFGNFLNGQHRLVKPKLKEWGTHIHKEESIALNTIEGHFKAAKESEVKAIVGSYNATEAKREFQIMRYCLLRVIDNLFSTSEHDASTTKGSSTSSAASASSSASTAAAMSSVATAPHSTKLSKPWPDTFKFIVGLLVAYKRYIVSKVKPEIDTLFKPKEESKDKFKGGLESLKKYTSKWNSIFLSILHIDEHLQSINDIVNNATNILDGEQSQKFPEFSIWRHLVGITRKAIFEEYKTEIIREFLECLLHTRNSEASQFRNTLCVYHEGTAEPKPNKFDIKEYLSGAYKSKSFVMPKRIYEEDTVADLKEIYNMILDMHVNEFSILYLQHRKFNQLVDFLPENLFKPIKLQAKTLYPDLEKLEGDWTKRFKILKHDLLIMKEIFNDSVLLLVEKKMAKYMQDVLKMIVDEIKSVTAEQVKGPGFTAAPSGDHAASFLDKEEKKTRYRSTYVYSKMRATYDELNAVLGRQKILSGGNDRVSDMELNIRLQWYGVKIEDLTSDKAGQIKENYNFSTHMLF